jgi:hypothetical protein
MEMIYRGVHYNSAPAQAEVIDAPVVGTYRGLAFRLHRTMRLPTIHHVLHLIYRGAPNEVAY